MPTTQGKFCHSWMIFLLLPIWDAFAVESAPVPEAVSQARIITERIEDLFVRWRYSGRSAGVDISPPRPGEWESLLEDMAAFKGKVESLAPSGGDRTDILDEYLYASKRVLMLFAAVEPERLEEIDRELALTVPGVASSFRRRMGEIKSGVLTDAEFEFRIDPLASGAVEVARSRHYLDRLKDKGEFLRSSKSPGELLFAVSRGEILARLKKSEEFVEKMLASGRGEDTLSPQEREARFRALLVDSLRNSSEVSKAFDIRWDWIDPEWSSRFLNILLPGKSYGPESEGAHDFAANFSLTAREYLDYAPSIFLWKVSRGDFEMGSADDERLEDFLCRSFSESIREGIDRVWMSFVESVGKEDSFRAFLDQTLPSPSCSFLEGRVGEWANLARERVGTGAENILNGLVEELAAMVVLRGDTEALLDSLADMEIAVTYYRAKKLSGEPEGDTGFARWIVEQSRPQSYLELKGAFLDKYGEQERMGRQRSASRFLQKLSGRGRENTLRMDEMAEFFGFDDEGRREMLYRELPGVSDSDDDRELLRGIVRNVQKRRYPVLQTEVGGQSLFETLGRGPEHNRKAVLLALKEIDRKIQDSIEKVNSWEDIDEMELALKNSEFLFHRLTAYSPVSGFFLKKYDDLQKDSNVKLMAKSLYHKYVGVGFGLLILVDFGPAIFKHVFRWAKGASYLQMMGRGVAPEIRHGFIVSAFSLIGVDLIYETWDVWGRQWPAFRDARELFESSALSETEVFSYPEYLKMEGYIDDRKTGYYWQAAIDSTFISILLFRHRIPEVIRNMAERHLRKTSGKIARAFKNLGVDPPYVTWDPQALRDIHRLRMREVESGRLAQERKLQELVGDTRPIRQLRKGRKFRRALKENGKVRETMVAYDAIVAESKQVHSGYRFLMDRYAKFQKRWELHGVEYRFDFEKLGLPVGEWNWRAIDEAYGGFKKALENDQISADEFARVQESFQKLNDFMMGRLHILKNYPILRELFLQSVIRDRAGLFLEHYSRRLSEDGLHLGYDVIRLKSDDGTVQDLIMARLHRQKLLRQEGAL